MAVASCQAGRTIPARAQRNVLYLRVRDLLALAVERSNHSAVGSQLSARATRHQRSGIRHSLLVLRN